MFHFLYVNMDEACAPDTRQQVKIEGVDDLYECSKCQL